MWFCSKELEIGHEHWQQEACLLSVTRILLYNLACLVLHACCTCDSTSHIKEGSLCLQAKQERQADHWSAGPGPSSSSSAAAPLSMPRSSSLTTAPSFATATAHLPLPAADPRQPPLHQVGAVRHAPGRQPFPAAQPALHSIPSQVGTESLLLSVLFLFSCLSCVVTQV